MSGGREGKALRFRARASSWMLATPALFLEYEDSAEEAGPVWLPQA